ncbi:MAG TPA: ABC transporter substrate-binding protein [Stellaceae bacterium]|nr:ABC transporter substrate-binding protein [Stellaceae bacterium]
MRIVGGWVCGAAIAALLAAVAAPAGAETLRVGKVVAQNFGFVPLNVGVAEGFFKSRGLDIDEFDFGGGAKQQQALVAGSIDIAIGGGTDLAFIVKGSPSLGVVAITSSASFMGYIVGQDSPIKTIDDLKGRKVGVTTAGSLTRWLVDQLNAAKGWGADGATPVPIGGELATELAALKTHAVDAFVDSPAIGYSLETQQAGRLLFTCSDYIHDLQVFIVFAATPLVEKNPDAVKRFVAGWLESVNFMRSHKDETVEIARKITGFSKPVEEREYDLLMPRFAADGKFDQKALAATARSFVDLKVLDQIPDLTKLYTERFLP